MDLLLHIVSRGCLGVDIAICRLRGLSLIADFRLWGVGYEVAEFTAAGGGDLRVEMLSPPGF